MSTIRIILAEDHLLIRASLKLLLSSQPGFHVVAEAANGKELLVLMQHHPCDIVLLDLEMPEMNGQEALTEIVKKHPGTKVIVLSGHSSSAVIQACLLSGASAYLSKACHEHTLHEAISAVHEKGKWFGEEVAGVLLNTMMQPKPAIQNQQVLKSLSSREQEVIRLLCKGKTEKQIAAALNISHHTVHTHRSHIYQKTGINNLADLVSHALRSGWI